MENQRKNKNVKSQSLEEKRKQQEMQHSLKLEIRRQKQEIHLNKEILHKQAKQIRREQLQELEKQKQKKKEEHRQSERKVLQEEEQKLNNIPSPAIIDIPAAPTESVMATNATDNQPLIHGRQVIIAEDDVTENIENDASVKTLRTEHDKEWPAESKKMNRRCRAKINKLLLTATQITQVTHELPVVEATEKTLKDLTEIQDLFEGKEPSERLEVRAESVTEQSPETGIISICDDKKNQNNKKIKNQRILQEMEQQLLKQELRRQRKEIQLNKEMLNRQEKQKRREKQQELEKQQRLKKEEKRQQLEIKRHNNQSQKQNATPATNDFTVAPTESVKDSAPCHSLDDLTEKQMCAEEDASIKTLKAEEELQADFQKTNERLIVKVDNLSEDPTWITKVAHKLPVVEVSHTKDLTALQDTVGDIKHLENSENSCTSNNNFENKTFCENHESAIRGLLEEIDNMRAKFTNLKTDIDLNVMVDEVRAECEINGREAIEKLKFDHETEVRNLHIYYNSKLNELHLNHGMVIHNLQRNHEVVVCNLRNLNYSQGVRQEAALRSMRELKDKTRQEHQQEIQDMRDKYDNMIREYEITIKSLIEEKKLLCKKHEKVVRDSREVNKVLRLDIVATMKSLRVEHEAAIKMLRNEYDSPVEMPNPDLTKQNGIISTEVEGLQRKLVEEEQQRTIITTTSNGQDVDDADTTTNTIADDDATIIMDMDKSQDTTFQKTVENYEEIINDTAQQLNLLHGYVFSKDSNYSSQTDGRQ